ncbi:unnamed protein product, partial [Peniophora sp. CBMAI 1063]
MYTFTILSCLDDEPNTDAKFYVDDGLLLAVSSSYDTNILELQHAFDTVTRKLQQLGLDIDADKTELIHFAPSRSRVDPGRLPHINIIPPNARARSVSPQPVMRWLGIWFDYKLTWKSHVEKMATRARSTIAGLRILANTVRGLRLANARLLYKTVVIPVLTFGAPVWYRGVRQKTLIKILEIAQNEGLRWMLGAFRTTPSAEMHHLGAILPIHILLKQLSHNAAIRLRTLPRTSQVLRRTPRTWDESDPHCPVPLPNTVKDPSATIIHHLASLTSANAEQIIPYHDPPWSRHHNWGDRLLVTLPERDADERRRALYVRDVRVRIDDYSHDPRTIVVFTDGSRRRVDGHRHRRTGAGFVIFRNGQEIRAGKRCLGRRAG